MGKHRRRQRASIDEKVIQTGQIINQKIVIYSFYARPQISNVVKGHEGSSDNPTIKVKHMCTWLVDHIVGKTGIGHSSPSGEYSRVFVV